MVPVALALTALLALAPALAPLIDPVVGTPAPEGGVPLPPGLAGVAVSSGGERSQASVVEGTAENVTGEDLDQEDVSLALALNITNTEFDVPGILFGGGKVEVAMEAAAHIEFRAVALRRIERALRETAGMGNGTTHEIFGFNASRMVVTAEEMRLAGAVVLRSFEEAQARAAIATIEESLPGVSVVSSRFEWTNAEPVWPGVVHHIVSSPAAHGRDPPLVMDARFQLEYIDRMSLLDALLGRGGAWWGPLGGSTAFEVIGVDQVLDAKVPPGWRGELTITVPKGYTIVSATRDVTVRDDLRTAMLPLDSSTDQGGPSSVTFSSRFLVVSAMLAVVLVTGLTLRMVAEPAARLLRQRGNRAPRAPGRRRDR